MRRLIGLVTVGGMTLAIAALATAQASQGPGTLPGTASTFVQMAMAIVVYGTSAAVIAAAAVKGIARRL